jgi:hypothetical protein
MKHWLAGALAASLTGHRIDAETPLVLMTSRGRIMLRTALLDPTVGAVSAVLRLFETAWRESQRMVAGDADSINASQPASTWTEDGGDSVAGPSSKA